MVEAVLSITLGIISISLLVFLFKKDQSEEVEEQLIVSRMTDIFNSSNEIASQNLSAYLKHIQQLEKMVLEERRPKKLPVDEDKIKEILMRGPEKVENEISKEDEAGGVDINDSNFRNIPFDMNTNVIIEHDEPTTIE